MDFTDIDSIRGPCWNVPHRLVMVWFNPDASKFVDMKSAVCPKQGGSRATRESLEPLPYQRRDGFTALIFNLIHKDQRVQLRQSTLHLFQDGLSHFFGSCSAITNVIARVLCRKPLTATIYRLDVNGRQQIVTCHQPLGAATQLVQQISQLPAIPILARHSKRKQFFHTQSR